MRAPPSARIESYVSRGPRGVPGGDDCSRCGHPQSRGDRRGRQEPLRPSATGASRGSVVTDRWIARRADPRVFRGAAGNCVGCRREPAPRAPTPRSRAPGHRSAVGARGLRGRFGATGRRQLRSNRVAKVFDGAVEDVGKRSAMKCKASQSNDMRSEYAVDYSTAVRGKYYRREADSPPEPAKLQRGLSPLWTGSVGAAHAAAAPASGGNFRPENAPIASIRPPTQGQTATLPMTYRGPTRVPPATDRDVT